MLHNPRLLPTTHDRLHFALPVALRKLAPQAAACAASEPDTVIPRMHVSEPSLEGVSQFVRGFASSRHVLEPVTRIEKDLSITGDEAVDLLVAAEERFSVQFDSRDGDFRRIFDLGPNECLFHSEGFLIDFPDLIRRLRGKPRMEVKDLTIRELHSAIVKAIRIASESAV